MKTDIYSLSPEFLPLDFSCEDHDGRTRVQSLMLHHLCFLHFILPLTVGVESEVGNESKDRTRWKLTVERHWSLGASFGCDCESFRLSCSAEVQQYVKERQASALAAEKKQQANNPSLAPHYVFFLGRFRRSTN